jgi:hypothetical protein
MPASFNGPAGNCDMMTNWMHANDTLQQLFLARMIILAAAIGMGIIVFAIGAVVVRCFDAARLWSGQHKYSGVVVCRRQRAVN